MKKNNFRSVGIASVSREAEKSFSALSHYAISEEEMHECDHCEEPWNCDGMCFKNLVKFRLTKWG